MGGDASIHIAVCDRAASYRRGLGAELETAGYVVADVEDPRVQPLVTGVDVVLLTVRTPEDWRTLRDVAANGAVRLVALLVDATPERQAEALRSGAHGVVGWEAAPETIIAVVSAAAADLTLLPAPVAQAIARAGAPLYEPDLLSPEEIDWLRLLSQGLNVQQLAEKAGYSERALYRLLQRVYVKMRVASRAEAIIQARRWGLLDQ